MVKEALSKKCRKLDLPSRGRPGHRPEKRDGPKPKNGGPKPNIKQPTYIWESRIWDKHMCPTSIKIVMNGVPVAPHGPILGQNEAYCFQEAL